MPIFSEKNLLAPTADNGQIIPCGRVPRRSACVLHLPGASQPNFPAPLFGDFVYVTLNFCYAPRPGAFPLIRWILPVPGFFELRARSAHVVAGISSLHIEVRPGNNTSGCLWWFNFAAFNFHLTGSEGGPDSRQHSELVVAP